MKPYPNHFIDIEIEIEDELDSKYKQGVVTKETIYNKSIDGGYKTRWYVDGKTVAFFTSSWDSKYEQWEGTWKVFNSWEEIQW